MSEKPDCPFCNDPEIIIENEWAFAHYDSYPVNAGTFCCKQPDELRAEFNEQLGDGDAGRVMHSCGSGVTACHNLFATELAGLGGSRLYPGSWSEWIRDPERPIATGP